MLDAVILVSFFAVACLGLWILASTVADPNPFATDDQPVPTTLNDLGREIVQINADNGWNVTTPGDWSDANKYKIPAVLALIHSEASEALEAYRNDDRENFCEEMADVLIRVLDATSGLGIDMDAEVRAKLEKNKTRGYRHGGKRV